MPRNYQQISNSRSPGAPLGPTVRPCAWGGWGQSIPLQAGGQLEEREALGEAPVRKEQPACMKQPPEGVEKSSAEAFLNA